MSETQQSPAPGDAAQPPVEGLTVRTTRSMFWSSLSLFTRQVMQFAITFLLMTLLEPADFGIVEIAGIFNSIIFIITDLGVGSAVIQRKELSEEHLSAAFWLNLAMGTLVLLLVAFVVSPLAVLLFHNPDLNFDWQILRPIMIVASLPLVIGPWGAMHRVLLQRELRFAPLAILDMVSLLAGGLVAVLMAFRGFGVWSLVTGPVVTSLLFVLFAWRLTPWRPRLQFRWSAARSLLGFGSGMVGFNLVNYMGANIDFVIVGRRLGQELLGIYTFAYDWGSFSYKRLMPFIGQVMFPAFASIQDDDARLRRGYLRLVSFASLISFPVMTGLMVIAPEFVQVVFHKFTGAIVPLQILCIAGMMYSINNFTGSIIMSKGRSDLLFRLSWVRLCGYGVAVLIGVRYGLLGVAIADVVYSSLTIWFFQWIAGRLIQLSLKDFIRALSPSIMVALTMGLLTLGWRLWLLSGLGLSQAWVLALTIPFGALATLAAAWVFRRGELLELWHTLGPALQPYRLALRGALGQLIRSR